SAPSAPHRPVTRSPQPEPGDPPPSERSAGLQPDPLGLEKEPSCLVLASRSCSSCLWPRRNRYSMCITSVFLMRAFSLNSSRIRGMKPGLTRTCCCSLLCRIVAEEPTCRSLPAPVSRAPAGPPQRSCFCLQVRHHGPPGTLQPPAHRNNKTSF
uniref:Uncharacterized protein n=1 Tax=Oryzias latipes TaxID=8090 RepID=A0A3P9L056_ORYLA